MELTCPKCQGPMRSYQRSGISVDQCAECRGIFLDRSDLTRLVDAETSFHASASLTGRVAPPAPPPAGYSRPSGVAYDGEEEDERFRDGRYREGRYDDHYAPRRSTRKSFLEQLFD